MVAVFPLASYATSPRHRSFSPAPATELQELGLLDIVDLEKRLSTAFLARYGPEVGREVTAETLAWAWEHRARLVEMDNPAGYLFRVGQSKSRRHLRWNRERIRFPEEHVDSGQPWAEPGLSKALAKLDEEHRTIVVLVHCFQWTYREVAELMGMELHGVRNRVHRAMKKLRSDLGAS